MKYALIAIAFMAGTGCSSSNKSMAVSGIGGDNNPSSTQVSDCSNSTELTQSMLDKGALTIEAGTCYDVRTYLRVRQAPLTLKPGVVLRFAQGKAMEITDDGRLIAAGTAKSPIVFTGMEKTRGYWKGLGVFTNSPDNICDHCVVEYGGSDAWTGDDDDVSLLYVGDVLSGSAGSLKLKNSTLRGSAHYAVLYADERASLTNLDNNLFVDNSRTAMVHIDKASDWLASNRFTDNGVGNDDPYIRLYTVTESVKKPQTWHAVPTPFLLVDGGVIEADLTIEPGAEVAFVQDAYLSIRSGGSLNAVGTAEKPIVFRGKESAAGYWEGIELYSRTDKNKIANARIEGAGSSAWTGDDDKKSAIFMDDATLVLEAVTIKDSGHYGIYVYQSSTPSILTCSGVTYPGLPAGIAAVAGGSGSVPVCQ